MHISHLWETGKNSKLSLDWYPVEPYLSSISCPSFPMKLLLCATKWSPKWVRPDSTANHRYLFQGSPGSLCSRARNLVREGLSSFPHLCCQSQFIAMYELSGEAGHSTRLSVPVFYTPKEVLFLHSLWWLFFYWTNGYTLGKAYLEPMNIHGLLGTHRCVCTDTLGH